MIAPMKKVYLVLLEKDKAEALPRLRELGLVHLEPAAPPSGKAFEDASSDREALARAANIVPPSKARGPARLSRAESVALAREVLALDARTREIYEESGEASRELERLAPWGDFEPADLAALRESGLDLRLYSGEAAALGSIPAEAEILVLAREGKRVRLASIGRGRPATALAGGLVELTSPSESPAALRARLEALAAEARGIGERLAAASAELPSLAAAAAAVDQRIAFEAARAAFASEGELACVKGYAPAKELGALADLARERGWGLASEDPGAEDAPPTKVELNPVTALIKPVFDFLGIVPGYGEYEISPYFLGFFALFSAMIFGDGGYGAIMLAGCLFAIRKSVKAGKGFTSALKLFSLIAVLTLAWGAVTGTWFSMPADRLPGFLSALAVWPISSANPEASKNVQVLCFVLGLLQLSIARIKNIVRDFPKLTFIAQAGSLALVWGMFFLVLNLVVDSKRFPVPPATIWLVAGGFAANIVFGAYDGSILKSLLEGLKGIIPSFLGSVGVFADIVSYIRLWALGLAGSSLAAIINTMGGGMFKAVAMAAAGALILLFGHALNVVLSVLSVVVHAIRLNILEFSCNHLGMQWSGVAYEPFRRTCEDDGNA